MAWDEKAYQDYLQSGGTPLKRAPQSGSTVVNGSGGTPPTTSTTPTPTPTPEPTSKPAPTPTPTSTPTPVSQGTKTTDNAMAYSIINNMIRNSNSWHTQDASGREASKKANQGYAQQLKGLGIDVTYNPSSGTWTYADGTNLYDTKYAAKVTYPKYNSQEDLIKSAYDNALQGQINANNEALALQKALLEQNLQVAQRDIEAQKRQSATDTAIALENEKLRQELRGSKGGIGERIFGTYESAGSQRLLQLNLEKERLRADTAAQIAQLEAEGRYNEAQLVSQFAIEKMNALTAEADRVYNAEVAEANFDIQNRQLMLDNLYRDKSFNLDIERFEEDKKNNSFSRTLALRQQEFNEYTGNLQLEMQVRGFNLDVENSLFDRNMATIGLGIQLAQNGDPSMLNELGFNGNIISAQAAFEQLYAIAQLTEDPILRQSILGEMRKVVQSSFSTDGTQTSSASSTFSLGGYTYTMTGTQRTDAEGGTHNGVTVTKSDGTNTSDSYFVDFTPFTGGNLSIAENGEIIVTEPVTQGQIPPAAESGGQAVGNATDESVVTEGDVTTGEVPPEATGTGSGLIYKAANGQAVTQDEGILRGVATLNYIMSGGAQDVNNDGVIDDVDKAAQENHIVGILNRNYGLGLTYDRAKQTYVLPDGTDFRSIIYDNGEITAETVVMSEAEASQQQREKAYGSLNSATKSFTNAALTGEDTYWLDSQGNIYSTQDLKIGGVMNPKSAGYREIVVRPAATYQPAQTQSSPWGTPGTSNVKNAGWDMPQSKYLTDADGFIIVTDEIDPDIVRGLAQGNTATGTGKDGQPVAGSAGGGMPVQVVQNPDGTYSYIATWNGSGYSNYGSTISHWAKQWFPEAYTSPFNFNSEGGGVLISGDMSKPVTDDVVDAVIRGDYGNGKERIDRLTAAGYDYDEVQGLVNKKAGGVPPYAEEVDRDEVEVGEVEVGNTYSSRADNIVRYAMTEEEFLESDIKDRFNGDYEDYIDSLCGVLTDEEKQYAHSGIIAKNGW